jgi:hypothetical protein
VAAALAIAASTGPPGDREDRCSPPSQAGSGHPGHPNTIAELLDEAMVGIRGTPPVHRELSREAAHVQLRLPPRAVNQALRSLITNAQDASPLTSARVPHTCPASRGDTAQHRDDTAGPEPRAMTDSARGGGEAWVTRTRRTLLVRAAAHRDPVEF